MLTSGDIRKLVSACEITGITSNPTIFEKTIGGGTVYDASLHEVMQKHPDSDAERLYELLAIEDIRAAA